MNVSIGLSYTSDEKKYEKYVTALQRAAESLSIDLEVVYLSREPQRIHDIDGIIFTGGADVDPDRYGKPELLTKLTDIDKNRDELEFELASQADERSIPIFGICRGLQLLNVHYGGTLIYDLESNGYPSHSKIKDTDKVHSVRIEPGTLLRSITRSADGTIASAHHQAIETPAQGMIISSRSEDGVIEAIEWADKEKRPYFLAVQWHPERMDLTDPLSAPLFEAFVSNAAMAKTLRKRFDKG